MEFLAALLRPRLFWPKSYVNNIWEIDEFTDSDVNKPIKDVKVEEISAVPVELPPGLHFEELRLDDDEQLQEVADFLHENYIQDLGNQFRLCYSKEFLRWTLLGPDWSKEWHFCAREGTRLVGTLMSSPITLMVNHVKLHPHALANFLCVSRDCR